MLNSSDYAKNYASTIGKSLIQSVYSWGLSTGNSLIGLNDVDNVTNVFLTDAFLSNIGPASDVTCRTSSIS